MPNATSPSPKRPPRPRSRLKPATPQRRPLGRPKGSKNRPKHLREERPGRGTLEERTAFDGTECDSIRDRRIYEGGIEHAEWLIAFIDDYPLTVSERATKSFLTRLYHGATEYLGWCLDTGRMPRKRTLPKKDSSK